MSVASDGRWKGMPPLGEPCVPELRVRDRHWLSFSCEEAIAILEDALGRGENGLDQIRIVLEGTHRGPLPDIPEGTEAITPPPGTRLHPGQEIRLRVRRPGIYDRLSAVLFTRPEDYVNQRGDNQAPARVDADETEARRYFQPFDREAMFVRSRIRSWRGVFGGARPDPHYRDFVWRLFGLPSDCRRQIRELLNEEQQNTLTFLLPHLPQIAGHPRQVRDVIQLLLPDPVQLRYGVDLDYDLPIEARSFLREGLRLGEQGLGDRLSTGEKALLLEVGPVPSERMMRYRCPAFVSSATGPLFELGTVGEDSETAGWGDLALTARLLCSLLVPVDVRVVLQPRPACSDWRLEQAARGRCGLDTFAIA